MFAEIARLGPVASDEMDRVFNRGIGMALVVDQSGVDAALGRAEGAGQAGELIGEVVEDGPGVRFT